MTPEETLDQLEDSIRKLGIEYDIYFSGGKKRPPADAVWRVDNYFRILNDNSNLKYAQRFRLNQLQQRYAAMSSVWRRKLQVKDDGWQRPADRLLSVNGAQPATSARARMEEVRISLGKSVDASNVEKLYEAFLKARELAAESLPPGSLENFRSFIQAKSAEIRVKQGVQEVEACVTLEQGRVKLALKGKKPS